ncbi:hypothetical protein D9758_004101 [Tetrapyrgos nigripes]|uniref:Uncharacterized protein n=1 Tax=Tetrapyrgos nigripes TaxID=182062 RepID=A0A8H5LVR3_9AGAR|nr:hypothetical protein D9758_004101 [Tetrapyrgos nigripes]
MGNPYTTQEDSETLWFEQSSYVATHLASVGYGIHIVIFCMVTYYTLAQRKRFPQSKAWIAWLVFNTLLFAFGTINLACSIRFNENAWVNDREYPGGPFAYMVEQQSITLLTLGNSASILASFLSDGLLLYRAAILWDFTWWIIIPPAVFYVACVILSILTTVQLALPDQTSWTPLSLPVWIVLMILPIWLTALIDAKVYTGVSAIVIESALPFTIISIILLGLFGDEDIAQNLFVALMVQIECIAPEMIVLRVMLGRAWTRETIAGARKGDRDRCQPGDRERDGEGAVLSEMRFNHTSHLEDSTLGTGSQSEYSTPPGSANEK